MKFTRLPIIDHYSSNLLNTGKCVAISFTGITPFNPHSTPAGGGQHMHLLGIRCRQLSHLLKFPQRRDPGRVHSKSIGRWHSYLLPQTSGTIAPLLTCPFPCDSSWCLCRHLLGKGRDCLWHWISVPPSLFASFLARTGTL